MTYAAESDHLFPTNENEYLSENYINEIVKTAAENAGLQETLVEYSDGRTLHKVTAHTLRHSFAMAQLNAGRNVRTLQTLLGHDELDTTLIYLDQSKDEAKEASRTFQPGV
jgi:integrase/recombinase XerD